MQKTSLILIRMKNIQPERYQIGKSDIFYPLGSTHKTMQIEKKLCEHAQLGHCIYCNITGILITVYCNVTGILFIVMICTT